MTRYRLAYERLKEPQGTPWGIELPSGERLYTGRVVFEVPAWTVTVPGNARFHGYLECEGRLIHDAKESRIVGE